MVKYYGRARQRTSGNTNSPGLNMSGTASSVGRSHSVQRYINRRVDSLAGVCGIPKQNGGNWKQSFKNKYPYCNPGASKCLAAAGGVGHIKTSYYRTPTSGEFGCNVTRSCEDEVYEFVDILKKGDEPTYSLISLSWCAFCKGAYWAINAIGETYNTIEYDLLNKQCQQLLVNLLPDIKKLKKLTFPQVYKDASAQGGADTLITTILNEITSNQESYNFNPSLESPINHIIDVKHEAKPSYRLFLRKLRKIYKKIKKIEKK
tara:strand:- start:38 stop:820 length:783 start_codon:yes stop_codon:yes gene_type:complete